MSEDELERLAEHDPQGLLYLMETMPAYELTFAAEHLGRHQSTQAVLQRLVSLLEHPKAYVREGALYGLAYRLDQEGVKAAVVRVSERDPVETIREVASDILSG